MVKKTFQYTCVSPRSLTELNFIIDNSRTISYKTFRSHIDELPKYDIPLHKDWSVSFHKSKTPKGKAVYYYAHSAIEHIYY